MKKSIAISLSILLVGIIFTSCDELCNGVGYDKDIYRCEYGELIGKCRGKDYYAAYEKCENGVVINSTASSSNSGTFKDSRDGKTYKWVKIGKQVWMAENLNYNASGSKCHENKTIYCDKYGRLYDWNTARVVCPKGWHLPSDNEWQKLVDFAGGDKIAGKKLKAKSGWNSDNSKSGDGTDKYGFSALPGGGGLSDGYFYVVGNFGLWWSASEGGSNLAHCRGMEYDSENAYLDYGDEIVGWGDCAKSFLFSVRCLQD